MKLSFIKMHGCGNDYVYIDCFEQPIADPSTLAVAISDRHRGVGGDGLVLICPPDDPQNDGRMRMFNADGSEGRMCGNAIRCVGKHLFERGHVNGTTLRVETGSGVKTLWLSVEDGVVRRVKVDMGAAILRPADIPVLLPGERAVNHPLEVGGKTYAVTCVSMGNPHAVVFCDDPMALNLPAIGPGFERHPLFPEQINTEFVHPLDAHTLQMRVWERGSGETMACGTGACASVVAATLAGYCPKGEPVTVRLRGGELTVCYTDETVTMEGPATRVFEGTCETEEWT